MLHDVEDRGPGWGSRAEFWAVFVVALGLVIFRAHAFLFYSTETFDSDQSTYAFMTRDIMRGHAYPMFMYGGRYIAAISTWAAVPVAWVNQVWGLSGGMMYGVTPLVMKIPMFILNLVTAALLLRLSIRETGLRPREAFVACLFFLIPSYVASYSMMSVAEASLETMFCALLIWWLRKGWFLSGLVAGIGFSNRPFIVYAAVALWMLEVARGEWRERRWRWRRLGMVAVWITISGLIRWWGSRAPNYGALDFGMYAKRVRYMFEDFRGFMAETLPRTIGLKVQTFVNEFEVRTEFTWFTLLLAGVGLYLLVQAIRWAFREGRGEAREYLRDPRYGFAIYLVLCGLGSVGGYVVMSPPSGDLGLIRYTLLSIFGLTGGYLLYFLGIRRGGSLGRALPLVFAITLSLVNVGAVAGSSRAIREYDREARTQRLIGFLRDRGFRYGFADYWVAYKLTFLSGCELVFSPPRDRSVRIEEFLREVEAQPARSRVVIQHEECLPGRERGRFEDWRICGEVEGVAG